MQGGGCLTIRTIHADGAVRVEFHDDGPGIPDDVIDRIFTPFFTTKPVGAGSGLGLDLAWRIVDRHGGSLSVQSQPGDTRFTVCLPLQTVVGDSSPRLGTQVAMNSSWMLSGSRNTTVE